MINQRLYGLIGFPLRNTFSVQYFSERFQSEGLNASYMNFPMADVNDLSALLEQYPQLSGLNVTIPHKTTVIPLLQELHPTAEAVGAVNTIKITHGKLTGYNTDVTGFEQSILPLLKPWHQKALILGTGGASRAVCYVFKKLGIPYHLVSRSSADYLQYDELNKALIRTHQIIVNCTPVGMFPAIDQAPEIPYEHITDLHLAYDLIYLPEETLFLNRCKQKGASTQNGLPMLHKQADEAYKIWMD